MTPLAQQISAARDAKGWSQRDLATEMGVSQQAIAHWESGGMPRGKRHEKLQTLLGIGLFKQDDTAREVNADVQAAVETLHALSAVLLNGELTEEDNLHVITAIDTLATMLARWHYIR